VAARAAGGAPPLPRRAAAAGHLATGGRKEYTPATGAFGGRASTSAGSASHREQGGRGPAAGRLRPHQRRASPHRTEGVAAGAGRVAGRF